MKTLYYKHKINARNHNFYPYTNANRDFSLMITRKKNYGLQRQMIKLFIWVFKTFCHKLRAIDLLDDLTL